MIRYLAVIFALAGLGFAQGEWVVQDNPFNGNDTIVFSDVHAVDSLHCWVVGYFTMGGRLVLRTSDGGKKWEATGLLVFNTNSFQSRLNDIGGPGITFIDTLQGWICIGHSVFSTRDGGMSWRENHVTLPNPSIILTDIEFVDSLNGWIVSGGWGGGWPLILHSSDGGEIWTIQDSLSIEYNLGGVCFLDSLKGYAVGSSGVLLRTIDGGNHWTKIATGTTKDLMDVQFADSLHGIAVGSDVVLRTVDGGVTWSVITQNIPALLTDVAFPDVVHAWTTTSGIYFSNDSGTTWIEQAIPDIPGSGALWGVSFPDTAHGWACGEYGTIIHYAPKTGIEEEKKDAQRRTCNLKIRPNPISQFSNIELQIPTSGYVSLKLYSAAGALIHSLVNENKGAGSYKINWNKSDMTSGIYFLKLELNNEVVVCKKIVLIN